MDIVKIFTSGDELSLQFDINEWLMVNKDKFMLKQISYSSSHVKRGYDTTKEYSAMLWYTTKPLC